jgi:hypothetical protein
MSPHGKYLDSPRTALITDFYASLRSRLYVGLHAHVLIVGPDANRRCDDGTALPQDPHLLFFMQYLSSAGSIDVSDVPNHARSDANHDMEGIERFVKTFRFQGQSDCPISFIPETVNSQTFAQRARSRGYDLLIDHDTLPWMIDGSQSELEGVLRRYAALLTDRGQAFVSFSPPEGDTRNKQERIRRNFMPAAMKAFTEVDKMTAYTDRYGFFSDEDADTIVNHGALVVDSLIIPDYETDITFICRKALRPQ